MMFPSNLLALFSTHAVSFFRWLLAHAKPEVAIPQSIEPFFENYCFDCYDANTAKADLDKNVSFTHRPIIEKALNELEKEKYPVRDMVLNVVLSDLFSQT